MRYLLDTNTIIYFFKGMGKVADNLLQTPPMDIGIPAIVLYELVKGACPPALNKHVYQA